MHFMARLLKNDSGATAIEYGLICGLIFLAIVAALLGYGSSLTSHYDRTMGTLGDAMS